jgi:LacI family transcriptional regulator
MLAKLAGVSHTTVSLALRNHPRVSERTRKRIRALADEMGYRPNALVSALMSQVRSNRRVVAQEVIGFLTGGPTSDWWREWPSIVENYQGARQRAEQLGFRLETLWLGPGGAEARSTAKVLHARAMRGAILAPLPVPHGSIELDWARLAVATIGYSFDQVPLHRAAHHHVNGVLVLYEQLRALGYRRIGLAMSIDELVRVKHYWLAGLLTGQELYGGDRVPHLIFQGDRNQERFFAWFKKQRPDVVVGVARDTYYWLKEARVRIPGDVGYAHLNLRDVQPGNIAGIEQKSVEIGAAATDLLVSQLYHNEYGSPATPNCTLLDGSWVPGATAPGRA